MSTHAVIRIEGNDYAEAYKHFDGYPQGTLPWLEKFNKEFSENRGTDVDYKFAQLLRSSVRDAEKFGLDDSLYTGWGIMPYGTADADFLYTLHSNGTVSVKSMY